MSTSTILRVLAALLAVALVGCASGSGSTASSDSADGSPPSGAVTIDDFAYDPATLEVPAGAEVTWTNDDDAPHTVTFSDDAIASSEQLETGDTFSVALPEAGTYAYVCALHPEMRGEVTVS